MVREMKWQQHFEIITREKCNCRQKWTKKWQRKSEVRQVLDRPVGPRYGVFASALRAVKGGRFWVLLGHMAHLTHSVVILSHYYFSFRSRYFSFQTQFLAIRSRCRFFYKNPYAKGKNGLFKFRHCNTANMYTRDFVSWLVSSKSTIVDPGPSQVAKVRLPLKCLTRVMSELK